MFHLKKVVHLLVFIGAHRFKDPQVFFCLICKNIYTLSISTITSSMHLLCSHGVGVENICYGLAAVQQAVEEHISSISIRLVVCLNLSFLSLQLRSGGSQILEGCIAEIPNISSLDISDNGEMTANFSTFNKPNHRLLPI